VLNLIVAGALCYGTWWRVDPYLYMTMMLHTPVPVQGVDLDEAATHILGISPEESGSTVPMPAADADSPLPAPNPPERTQQYRSDTAQAVIFGSAYIWLALATIACCVVAASGGASLGRAGGRPIRTFGVIAASGGMLALVYVVYQMWGEYGWQYRPTHWRTGMSLLVLLTAFAGLVVARGARRLTRLAAVLLIVSAAGSVAGLYLGAQAGAIPVEQSTPMFLALVFIIHSLYGWILLPVSSRVAR
jgi:hypothetical protein